MSSIYDKQLTGEVLNATPNGPFTGSGIIGGPQVFQVPHMNHGMFITNVNYGATGSVTGATGGTIRMDVSPDGANWVTSSATLACPQPGVTTTVYYNGPAALVRAVGTGVTGSILCSFIAVL